MTQLQQNDYECRHQIVIFIEIVSDAAPCTGPTKTFNQHITKKLNHLNATKSTLFLTANIDLDSSEYQTLLCPEFEWYMKSRWHIGMSPTSGSGDTSSNPNKGDNLLRLIWNSNDA